MQALLLTRQSVPGGQLKVKVCKQHRPEHLLVVKHLRVSGGCQFASWVYEPWVKAV